MLFWSHLNYWLNIQNLILEQKFLNNKFLEPNGKTLVIFIGYPLFLQQKLTSKWFKSGKSILQWSEKEKI